MLPQLPSNGLFAGSNYLIEGMRLLLHPKLRVYVLIPLLVNCVLFFVLTGVLLNYLFDFIGPDDAVSVEEDSWMPGWISKILTPLKWIAWIILGALFVIIYGYSFNIITNLIAAPFYGLLAEATEKLLTGQEPPAEPLWQMIPRTFLRELSKLGYFIVRGLVVILVMILIGFIPILNLLAPLVGIAWGAWCMSIQYADYAADNHQTEFSEMRNCLWARMKSSLGFGGTIMGCSMVPVLNIIVMPAAVIGGTVYWLNEMRHCRKSDKPSLPEES
jgi:CysZ protein